MKIRARTPLLFSLSLLLFTGCTDPASKLPNYGKVPAFTMTDAEGHTFDGDSLRGKVWIADFIYTNCPAECPLMTARMHKIEQRVKGEDNVRLVSISVDPERDTPPVLKAFAQRFGASPKDWIFLTGNPQTVHLLAYVTFHVGDVIGKIEHSTKFIVVDKNGYIRGYYSSFDADDIRSLLNDVSALRRAKS